MHRRAGVKMHHGWMPDGPPREAFFASSLLMWVRTGGSVCDGGSALLPVERLVANKAGGASLCQRRQPPKAGAEGQRLQRLVPPATIGPRVGWADHAGYANDCLRCRVAQ
jgi:hypothetical protein